MKHNTELLVQSRRLIDSVFMCSSLPTVNKADIIQSFLMEISCLKMCMRSNHTRSNILSYIFPVVKRLGLIEERSICTSDAIKIQGLILVTLVGQQLT